MKETDTEAEIREMFKVFDMDGNGFISAEEFKWTMMNLHNQLTEEEVNEIIKTADLNGDGQIDLKGNFNFFFCFVLFFYVQYSIVSSMFDLFDFFSLPVSFVCTCDLSFIKSKVYVGFQANLNFLTLFTKPSQ